MSESPTALPDFADPPVIEVLLAVHFEPLSALRTPHLGLLWQEFRDRFPNIEEHPSLPPVTEQFNVKRPQGISVRLEMIDVPPRPRLWFLNKTGTELIQIQHDRFVHNWRKVGEGDEYPRYERILQTFTHELDIFRSFLSRESLGELLPTICEVTYINHIRAGKGWERHGQLGEVIAVWNQTYTESLPEAEQASLAARYIIPDDAGNPIGRLHIRVTPEYSKEDNRPIFVLALIARGRPIGEGTEGVMRFFDIGRAWVARGFTSITTPKMQRIWGRRDDQQPS